MFFNLFRSRLPMDLFEGASDMHSHLLPGVDDGFPDFEKTMGGLRFLRGLGYRKAKMTPHFMRENRENTRPAIEAKYAEFLAQAAGSLPVELSLAGEYMLDSCFLDRFAEGLLTLDAAHTLVLCETSYMMMDSHANEMLYQVGLKGYRPVMAHPERYNYASMELYRRWKEKDYLLQLNLLSLAGAYGNLSEAKARRMLVDGMYDYVGTDLHRVVNVERMIHSIRLSTKERDRLSVLLENNKSL